MAAGSTYTPIATTTLVSAAASYTFSSIPSSYTDLVLVINANITSGSEDAAIQFNGDTGTNYSRTVVFADSINGALSVRSTSQSRISVAGFSSTIGNAIIQVQNYSNTTTNKTALCRGNLTGQGTYAIAGLWRNTAAITSITVGTTGSTWTAGSTFTLYGIAAA
jgi:hypothetical protein